MNEIPLPSNQLSGAFPVLFSAYPENPENEPKNSPFLPKMSFLQIAGFVVKNAPSSRAGNNLFQGAFVPVLPSYCIVDSWQGYLIDKAVKYLVDMAENETDDIEPSIEELCG